jgi:CubicO group peptidase (beta-lactamase class C family)
VVSLAVGLLLDEGRIKSLDQPVSDFYPEWRQGAKRRITIRHLLTHTSGLQNAQHTSEEIYPSGDFVQLALAAELTSEPGTAGAYNNKAVNLLAGVVEQASGQKLDAYLRERLFTPLGIVAFEWSRDDAGNPHAMSGLQIRPRDFARR